MTFASDLEIWFKDFTQVLRDTSARYGGRDGELDLPFFRSHVLSSLAAASESWLNARKSSAYHFTTVISKLSSRAHTFTKMSMKMLKIM